MNDYDRTILEGLHHDLQQIERERLSVKWKQAEIDDRLYREEQLRKQEENRNYANYRQDKRSLLEKIPCKIFKL